MVYKAPRSINFKTHEFTKKAPISMDLQDDGQLNSENKGSIINHLNSEKAANILKRIKSSKLPPKLN